MQLRNWIFRSFFGKQTETNKMSASNPYTLANLCCVCRVFCVLPIRLILSSVPSCLMRASWCSKRVQDTTTQLCLHSLHIRRYSTHVLNKLLQYYKHVIAVMSQLSSRDTTAQLFFQQRSGQICSKEGCLAHICVPQASRKRSSGHM